MLDLPTLLADIPGIARFAPRFKRLGLLTVRELLYHFPARYEDFSEIYRIADLEPGQHATVQGVVESLELRHTWRKHFTIVEAEIRDESGTIRAIWFNQPYVKNVLKPGRLVNFSGKVSASEEDIYLNNPTYEPIGREETKHTARLVPVYPETKGLTSKGIRFVLQPILVRLATQIDWLPEETRTAHDLPELNQALHNIHFPERIDDAERAKRRFAFEDLFLLQLLNLKQKLRLAQTKAPVISTDLELLKNVLGELPFELTQSQKRSLWEILQDLAKGQPMNRLLQGDVGSGKTAVAALAAVVAAKNGYETAVMAPTEVLARQHFDTFRKLLGGIKSMPLPPLGLLTAAHARIVYDQNLETEIKKSSLREEIERGRVRIVIGTHALIAGSAKQIPLRFPKLGLVVIDEQHRFGVDQRALLIKRTGKNGGQLLPHFLSMSATPIPRTLMLTIFGDLDLSTIDELPKGRKNIVTKIVAPEDRTKAYAFIRTHIKRGRQAFVICPRIAAPEGGESRPESFGAGSFKKFFLQQKLWEVKSVKEEYEKLAKKIFPDLRVAMLHGQMPARASGRGLASGGKATKESVMRDFKEGKIDVLVSTSVIEVGVDVPNATIMMIEGADRFGLAQLYQFRGRVGRGEHQSFCFLFTDSTTKQTGQRLQAIVDAKNGFELAEKDLELRGPGEFLGQKQTGLPDIAMRGLQDVSLIKESRAAAVELLRKDPTLKRSSALVVKLNEFQAQIHLE